MAMWENVAVYAFLILVAGISAWRSFKHGDLRKLIGFFKVASKVNNDLFDGETKTFVLDRNGEEKPVEIKTVSDALNLVFSGRSSSGKLYFGPQRAGGLHLEFNVFSQYDDDFMRFIEKEGEEVINTSEFNLDKMGPAPLVEVLTNLIGRMATSPTTWWDEAALATVQQQD